MENVELYILLREFKDGKIGINKAKEFITVHTTKLIKEAYRNGYAIRESVEAGLERYDEEEYAKWAMLGGEKNKL